MSLPPIVIQALVQLGLQLAQALGAIVSRHVQARYARLAETNPTLAEPEIKKTANLLGEMMESIIDEVNDFSFGAVWTKDEVNQLKRERSWRELVARAAARNIIVTENTARRTAEEALEARKAAPVLEG